MYLYSFAYLTTRIGLQSQVPAVVASAFRRVKDSREMGEAHGSEQEHILAERGEF